MIVAVQTGVHEPRYPGFERRGYHDQSWRQGQFRNSRNQPIGPIGRLADIFRNKRMMAPCRCQRERCRETFPLHPPRPWRRSLEDLPIPGVVGIRRNLPSENPPLEQLPRRYNQTANHPTEELVESPLYQRIAADLPKPSRPGSRSETSSAAFLVLGRLGAGVRVRVRGGEGERRGRPEQSPDRPVHRL